MTSNELTRRDMLTVAAAGTGALVGGSFSTEAASAAGPAKTGQGMMDISLRVNGAEHRLSLDPRTTLLDALREHLRLTGTKKGCDHGQCGACTVLVNGRRINSCLTLAAMHDGDHVTTVEGLAKGTDLHPMQAAFIEYDGLQCGYCTPGQICSAIALLDEINAGAPSFVTSNLSVIRELDLTDEEIKERMSGNICRCGAYAGIVAAVRAVYGRETA